MKCGSLASSQLRRKASPLLYSSLRCGARLAGEARETFQAGKWLHFSSNNSDAGRRKPTRPRLSGNCANAATAFRRTANSADVVVVNTCTVTGRRGPAGAPGDSRDSPRKSGGANCRDRMLRAARAGGTCCAQRRFLGGGKFAQAGNSAPDRGDEAGRAAHATRRDLFRFRRSAANCYRLNKARQKF